MNIDGIRYEKFVDSFVKRIYLRACITHYNHHQKRKKNNTFKKHSQLSRASSYQYHTPSQKKNLPYHTFIHTPPTT